MMSINLKFQLGTAITKKICIHFAQYIPEAKLIAGNFTGKAFSEFIKPCLPESLFLMPGAKWL